MSISVSIGGGGGGFSTATLETTTGDSETKLQEVSLPSEDGVYAVKAYASVTEKGGANNHAAYERLMKSFRVSGGSIVETVDHSNEESFQDLVSGLFSSGDIDLKADGQGNVGIYGTSPYLDLYQKNNTKDLSSVSGISNATGGSYSVDTDPSSGEIHLAFYDGTSLKYLKPDGSIEEISSKTPADFGQSVDLEVDGAGVPHVAFSDDSSLDLYYSNRSGGSWSSDVLIDNSSNFRRLSLALDSNGDAHIAYTSNSNGDLLYAQNTSGSWSTETLESSIEVQQHRIHVSGASNVGIIYADATNGHTKIATGETGSFNKDEIDTSNELIGGDLSYNGSSWEGAFLNVANREIFVFSGTSGSFSSNSLGESVGLARDEGLIYAEKNGDSVFLVEGDENGNDPYDAVVYDNRDGNFAKKGVVHQLGDHWASHSNMEFLSVSDGGSGDTTAVSVKIDSQSTLKWRTGAEVLNADA